MIILGVISTLFMILIVYFNKKLAILLNLTFCITDEFNHLIHELRTNKKQAIGTINEFNQNYNDRKIILEEINRIKGE